MQKIEIMTQKSKQWLTILLHWFTLSLNGTGRWSGLDGGNKTFAINTSFSQWAVTIRFPSEIAWKINYRGCKNIIILIVFTAVVQLWWQNLQILHEGIYFDEDCWIGTLTSIWLSWCCTMIVLILYNHCYQMNTY